MQKIVKKRKSGSLFRKWFTLGASYLKKKKSSEERGGGKVPLIKTSQCHLVSATKRENRMRIRSKIFPFVLFKRSEVRKRKWKFEKQTSAAKYVEYVRIPRISTPITRCLPLVNHFLRDIGAWQTYTTISFRVSNHRCRACLHGTLDEQVNQTD